MHITLDSGSGSGSSSSTLCFKKTGTLFVFAITLLVVIRF